MDKEGAITYDIEEKLLLTVEKGQQGLSEAQFAVLEEVLRTNGTFYITIVKN